MKYAVDFNNPVLALAEPAAVEAVEFLRDYLQGRASKELVDNLRIGTSCKVFGIYQRLHAGVTERARVELITQRLNAESGESVRIETPSKKRIENKNAKKK